MQACAQTQLLGEDRSTQPNATLIPIMVTICCCACCGFFVGFGYRYVGIRKRERCEHEKTASPDGVTASEASASDISDDDDRPAAEDTDEKEVIVVTPGTNVLLEEVKTAVQEGDACEGDFDKLMEIIRVVTANWRIGKYHSGSLTGHDFPGGNAGRMLGDFMQSQEAKSAGLEEAELVALRFYTSSSARLLSKPLRQPQQETPHPLAGCAASATSGVRKLRAFRATIPALQNPAKVETRHALDAFERRAGADAAAAACEAAGLEIDRGGVRQKHGARDAQV